MNLSILYHKLSLLELEGTITLVNQDGRGGENQNQQTAPVSVPKDPTPSIDKPMSELKRKRGRPRKERPPDKLRQRILELLPEDDLTSD